jgi:hypothetical protein
MKNVSDRNLKLLDILLGPLEKTDPIQEINRIFKLYFDKLIFIDDQYLMNTFRGIVENKIYYLIIKDFRFYDLESYTEKYSYHLQDFLGDIPDSTEEDFIDRCIAEQNSILDNTAKYFLKIQNNEPINALQFVNEEFFEEFKSSSKRKIEFLENIQKFELAIKQNNLINEYENPYPDYFKSYGYELFNIFLKEDLNSKNKILAKCSFLVNELRKDNLMCSDFSLKKTFDFLIETFDLNLGKSTKFKSEYSRDKYLPLYILIKSNFLKD